MERSILFCPSVRTQYSTESSTLRYKIITDKFGSGFIFVFVVWKYYYMIILYIYIVYYHHNIMYASDRYVKLNLHINIIHVYWRKLGQVYYNIYYIVGTHSGL